MINGAIQLLVYSFPGTKFNGDIIPAIQKVVDQGLVRIVDLVFVRKDADSNVTMIEAEEAQDDLKGFDPIVDMISGLVTDEDIVLFGDAMEPDSSAAVLVFEHLWASEVGEAIARANGTLIADGMLPRRVVQEIIAAYGVEE